ncbi:7557_t:CDS:2, partial [Funneliformis geosporum]
MSKNYQLIKRGEIEPYFDGLQSRKRYAKFWDGVKYDPEVIKFQSTQLSSYDDVMIRIYTYIRTGASIMGPLDTCK